MSGAVIPCSLWKSPWSRLTCHAFLERVGGALPLPTTETGRNQMKKSHYNSRPSGIQKFTVCLISNVASLGQPLSLACFAPPDSFSVPKPILCFYPSSICRTQSHGFTKHTWGPLGHSSRSLNPTTQLGLLP